METSFFTWFAIMLMTWGTALIIFVAFSKKEYTPEFFICLNRIISFLKELTVITIVVMFSMMLFKASFNFSPSSIGMLNLSFILPLVTVVGLFCILPILRYVYSKITQAPNMADRIGPSNVLPQENAEPNDQSDEN